jgi:hypothetical protein
MVFWLLKEKVIMEPFGGTTTREFNTFIQES